MLDHLQEVVRHAAGLAQGQVFRRSDWTRKRFVYVLPAWLPDDDVNSASWALEDAWRTMGGPMCLLVRVERSVYGTCLAGYGGTLDARLASEGWHYDELRGPAGVWVSPDEQARQALGSLFDWTASPRKRQPKWVPVAHRSGDALR